MATSTKFTNGDLSGMDAGELREHAAFWIAEHGWDDAYTDALIERIHGHFAPGEMSLHRIIGNLSDDVEAIG